MKHYVTYTATKNQDIYKINAQIMLVCKKKFINLCQA